MRFGGTNEKSFLTIVFCLVYEKGNRKNMSESCCSG